MSAHVTALPELTHTLPPKRFVVIWAGVWAFIGCIVAAGIDIVQDEPMLVPALKLSIPFAEVVGFTALVAARLVFPFWSRLPIVLRSVLQLITLISGTIFGSVVVLFFQPLFTLASPSTVGLIVLINAAIAVIVGFALRTYDRMREEIESNYEGLRRKEALERELRIARDVQQELLPRAAPQIDGLELAGVCIPAFGVGGDYYDFLQLAETRVGLVIGDVSGKGVAASLLMAGLQASLRSLSRPGLQPAEINARLNEVLHRSSSAANYATLFLGFYDTESRTFCYSNAGHHHPLLLHHDRMTRIEGGGGLPIGMFDDTCYGEGNVQLEPGDMVTLFTDGVIETPNTRGEEFGEPRLIELLRREADRPLEEITRTILDELGNWGGDTRAYDDVTLVLARTG